MTLFPVEHPCLNVVESNILDCKCIIDSSAGLVWEKLSLNTLSHLIVIHTYEVS